MSNRYLAFHMPLVDDPTDNCCVNVFPIGNQLFTMTETPYWLAISQDTLKTLDRVCLNYQLVLDYVTPLFTVYSDILMMSSEEM